MYINRTCIATKASWHNSLLNPKLKCISLICSCSAVSSVWTQRGTSPAPAMSDNTPQSSCSSGIEKLEEIKETLAVIQQTLATSFNGLQQTIATSFDNLVGKLKQQRLRLS